jgi:predicted transcriptional regulator
MSSTVIERIDGLLKKANFETFSLGDFGSKKSKFCQDIVRDIKSLSTILKSKPLLIGIKNRYQKLEDNTIYVRNGLPFITLNTLEKILKNNVYPYILAKRGGGVVYLDGVLMKELREQHSITRKELSEKLGITKRTVCSYENESMRPSEEMARKILNILEDSEIFKKINIFKWNVKYEMGDNEYLQEKELSEFESQVQTIVNDIGLSSYWYKKGSVPFKLSLFSSIEKAGSDGFYPLFSALSDEHNKVNEVNFNCLKMFNDLFHKTALYIVDNSVRIPGTIKGKDIHIIKIKNLEQVDDEEEFIELIQDS